MNCEPIADQSGACELASLGDILYAFGALQSRSGRRRAGRAESEVLPWRTGIQEKPVESPAPPVLRPIAAPAVRRAEPEPPRRIVKARRGPARCQCGQCRTCLENARWERIFQEKFASPDYYRHEIRIRHSSPLSSI